MEQDDVPQRDQRIARWRGTLRKLHIRYRQTYAASATLRQIPHRADPVVLRSRQQREHQMLLGMQPNQQLAHDACVDGTCCQEVRANSDYIDEDDFTLGRSRLSRKPCLFGSSCRAVDLGQRLYAFG